MSLDSPMRAGREHVVPPRVRKAGRKAGSVVGLLAAAVGLVVAGWTILAAGPLDVSTCAIPQPAVAWPRWLIYVAAGVAAFGLGNLLGRWRDFSNEVTEHEPPGDDLLPADAMDADRRHRRRAWAVQLMLAASLTTVTVLLGYETWAELASPPRSPITDFVRCASHVAFPQTLVASTALLFLAGHWLWHPVRGMDP